MQVLGIAELGEGLRQRTICNLREVCGKWAVLPDPCLVLRRISKAIKPHAADRHAEVFQGKTDPAECVKVIKSKEAYAVREYCFHSLVHLPNNDSQGFCGEVAVWVKLDHGNIVQCFGLTANRLQLEIVMQWMPNGQAMKYVQSHKAADRVSLVSSPVLRYSANVILTPDYIAVDRYCSRTGVSPLLWNSSWEPETGKSPFRMVAFSRRSHRRPRKISFWTPRAMLASPTSVSPNSYPPVKQSLIGLPQSLTVVDGRHRRFSRMANSLNNLMYSPMGSSLPRYIFPFTIISYYNHPCTALSGGIIMGDERRGRSEVHDFQRHPPNSIQCQ